MVTIRAALVASGFSANSIGTSTNAVRLADVALPSQRRRLHRWGELRRRADRRRRWQYQRRRVPGRLRPLSFDQSEIAAEQAMAAPTGSAILRCCHTLLDGSNQLAI